MNSLATLAIFGMGGLEIVVVLVIVLILFGSRLPRAAKALGSSIKEFRKGVSEGSGSPQDEEPRLPEGRDDRPGDYGARDRESERRR
ncbi:MAG TPA: twin-arginine translocase TatA/TatE family subunit [Planctomycetota bacterium]|nr:twin-arginine translocase TatA/TatE family subunit [Planctomycetota bacterium]